MAVGGVPAGAAFSATAQDVKLCAVPLVKVGLIKACGIINPCLCRISVVQIRSVHLVAGDVWIVSLQKKNLLNLVVLHRLQH